MRAVDVFTPGKVPTVTFVSDHLNVRRERLRDALDQGGMLISISGPSKSGKTVFIKNVLGAECVVPVTGAGVSSPDQLWERVFHAIGTPLGTTATKTTQSSSKIAGNGELAGSVLVAKGKVGVSVEQGAAASDSVAETAALSHLGLLIKELAKSGMTLFIDDFHYIPADQQEELARQIKEAIANDVQIICASVPYRSEDVLRANPDLRGRVVGLDFDYWDVQTLQKIGELGFAALNVTVDPVMLKNFAMEAAGSPQLMQAIC